MNISYIIVGALVLIVIVCGIIMRTKKFGVNTRSYREAMLVETQKEYGEVTDSQGQVHKGVVKMTLVFQMRNGEQKAFEIDKSFRGHVKEHQWGNLMYEGDKLLKFQTEDGAIGSKLYVQKNNSVFHKFRQ